MKKRMMFSALMLIASNALAMESTQEGPILAEATTAVILSSTDVNRINCPTPIQDLIFSTEKGIEGKFVGTNAFIKYKVIKQGEKMTYISKPTEFHVVCGGQVYTLIATPKKVDAVTLRLASPKKDSVEKNISLFTEMPLEKKVLRLIRQAYQGEYPPSYMVQSVLRSINISSELIVLERRIIHVEGEALVINEMEVRNPVKNREVVLNEKDFLKTDVGTHILGIALEDMVLKPGEQTRAFVVRHQAGSGGAAL